MSRRVGSHRVTAPAPKAPGVSLGSARASSSSRSGSGSGSRRAHLPPVPASSRSTRHPPAAKNLRWTAMAVASVLCDAGEQKADEVAERVARAAETDTGSNGASNGGKDKTTPAVRNARRRVYDALKVMVAAGSVAQTDDDLRWIGVDHLQKSNPHLSDSHPSSFTSPLPPAVGSHTNYEHQFQSRIKFTPGDYYHKEKDKGKQLDVGKDLFSGCESGASLRVDICRTRTRIARKRAIASALQRRIDAFHALATRRTTAVTNQVSGRRRTHDSSPRIHFPLMLIKTAQPDAAHSADRCKLRVNARSPFQLFSETDLVCMIADRWSPSSRRRRAREARLSKLHVQALPSPLSSAPVVFGNMSKNTCEGTSTPLPEDTVDDRSLVDFELTSPQSPAVNRVHVVRGESKDHTPKRKRPGRPSIKDKNMSLASSAQQPSTDTCDLPDLDNASSYSPVSRKPIGSVLHDDTHGDSHQDVQDDNSYRDITDLADSEATPDFIGGDMLSLPILGDEDDSSDVDAYLEAMCNAAIEVPDILGLTVPPETAFEHVKPTEICIPPPPAPPPIPSLDEILAQK